VRWLVGFGAGAPRSSNTMRKQHSTSRAVALRRRPRLMIEVIHAAEILGIDPIREPQHMWLAEEALSLELPMGWRAYEARSGHEYYHNELLELRQWQHPNLSYLIALLRTFQQRDRMAQQIAAVAFSNGDDDQHTIQKLQEEAWSPPPRPRLNAGRRRTM